MAETGWFYSSIIDPILRSMRKKVAVQISSDETVIDIACGTGAQIFELAGIARSAVGVDLSESMIKFARRRNKKRGAKSVEFVIADATNLSQFADAEFDVATMSLALHQFAPELYTPILYEMKRIAKRIVIVDYAVPMKNNLAGIASKTIEFFAGREHNRCFRAYYKRGGLDIILKQNGLLVQSSKYFGGGAFVLVVCTAV